MSVCNLTDTVSLQKRYVYKTKTKQNKKFTDTKFKKTQNLQTRYVYKTQQKMFKHVMFTKQNKTVSLQTRYVYKIKQSSKFTQENKTVRL